MDFLENYEEANVYYCYNSYPNYMLACLYCNANHMENIASCIDGYTSTNSEQATCGTYVGNDKTACKDGYKEGQKTHV